MMQRMHTPPTDAAARETTLKRVARWLLAIGMVGIGVSHFANPDPFVAIVPAWLPAPRALVLVSGAAEVAGGIGLVVPVLARAAAIGLILLYVTVFPANVNMALHHIEPGGKPIPEWALWARLPFQALFIAWAGWLARRPLPRSS